jgi:hypothetical protein
MVGAGIQHWAGVADAMFIGFLIGVVVAGLVPNRSNSCRIN